MPSELPRSLEQVTPAWLSRALGQRYPDVDVRNVVVDRVINGAATKVRLLLDYTPGRDAGLPAAMWLKAGWEAHSDWLASGSRIYAREALFYGQLADQLKVAAPRAYYAEADADGHGVVLIEDLQLRGARFGEASVAASVAEVEAMMDNFARLHARWWNSPELEQRYQLDVPMRANHPSSDWPRSNTPEVIASYLASSRGDALPAAIKDPERIDRAFWKMVDDMSASPQRCLLHGDAHPGNSFVDADGSPGFYDWQTLSAGPWGHDVSYYMVSALPIEERRQHDRRLLRYYLERLQHWGVEQPPKFDEAWLHHRRYIAYGLHIWLTNRVTFQSEANCTALSTRLGTAAHDYDFFQAWGV